MIAADAIWLIWWVWGVLALGLLGMEIVISGFISLGFAIGAGIIALVLFVMPELPLAPSVVLLIFALLSLAAWLVLRRVFAAPKGQVKTFDHDIND